MRIGAPSAAEHDGNYAAGRAPSGAVHGGMSEADRFVFASPFTGDSYVAIFERAFRRLRASGIAELVRHVQVLEVLDDYDIVPTASPGRAKCPGRIGSWGVGLEPYTRPARPEGGLLTVGG